MLRVTTQGYARKGYAMGTDERLSMKKLAEEHHVASPGELLEVARDLGVHLVPCQMTMDLLGLTNEDLIDGLDEPAGATTALLEAQDAVSPYI